MIPKLICSTFAAIALATPALPDGLDVTVDGVRNAKGNILIVVFDDANAYNTLNIWKAADYAEIPAREGQVRHEFSGLTKGPYAVFLFHDENGDEDLNATATRLLEGVGASGAPNPQDEPDFAAASVWPGTVLVRVHYDR